MAEDSKEDLVKLDNVSRDTLDTLIEMTKPGGALETAMIMGFVVITMSAVMKLLVDNDLITVYPKVEVSGNCCRCGWDASMCKCWQNYYLKSEFNMDRTFKRVV